MKIVHTEASLGFGGQEMRILTEAAGLQERGHQLTLLCPQEAEIYSIAKARGLDVVALPIGKKRLPGLIALYRWLKANRPDVVNTHSSTDSWLTAIATRLMRNPPTIVRTRHVSVPIKQSPSSRWLYTKATRHIVTTGEKLRQTLIKENGFPAEQVTSIRTGIDLERFKPGDKQTARHQLNLPQDKILIGIVATLRSWKGHRYLLEAFANLSQKENLRLLIVGDGPLWDSLHNQVKTLNLENNVIFAGRQSNIETWLQTMDIFCLPSYANEGVPQSLMQAQACGIPVITTLVGSINEAIIPDQTARIVPPENGVALQQALAYLLDHPEICRHMGREAAAFAAKNFSITTMLDAMEAVFTNAITVDSTTK